MTVLAGPMQMELQAFYEEKGHYRQPAGARGRARIASACR